MSVPNPIGKLPKYQDDPTHSDTISDEQAKKLGCAMLGHPTAHPTTDGRYRCRCGERHTSKPAS